MNIYAAVAASLFVAVAITVVLADQRHWPLLALIAAVGAALTIVPTKRGDT